MTEMQFTNADEALEYLREQLCLATELTMKLMNHVDRLQPGKFAYMRTTNAAAVSENSGRPDGKAPRKPILRLIEGGLGKDKD